MRWFSIGNVRSLFLCYTWGDHPPVNAHFGPYSDLGECHAMTIEQNQAVSAVQANVTAARLTGRWLILARIVWVSIA
jgi:hypothetical protein